MRFLVSFFLLLASTCVSAQKAKWVDSVFTSLSQDERIAQLLVIRTSSQDANGNPIMYDSLAYNWVSRYNVGAVCLFQGSPLQQAALINRIQQQAKTPIMVTVDGEWGLGMRFAGVKNFPYQLTLGALPDAKLVYQVGEAIAAQCRRMNIHVNYAPVVDINNNPANPVIGVRSFGEDKYKVALMGTRIMQGMQDHGVMACAKHFPGHGDVSVDSHYDLPLISKSMEELKALELYPFQALFAKGVGSVMVAHLAIPAIDSTPNKPTSISYNNITTLMRNELGYKGLTFTDALEMKGVAKFYPSGEAAVQSIIAGNDMLCLPADVATTINAVNKAIADGRLTRENIDAKCKRVLAAKYDYVYGKTGKIDTTNLLADLNKQVETLRKQVAVNAITVVRGSAKASPIKKEEKVAYVVVGNVPTIPMANLLKKQKNISVFFMPLKNATAAKADSVTTQLKAGKFSRIIVGVHDIRRSPAAKFGMHDSAIAFVNNIAALGKNNTLMVFGNPYALAFFEQAPYKNIVACYEDDAVFHQAAYEWLMGKFAAKGKLPVTVNGWKYGTGMAAAPVFTNAAPETVGMNSKILKAIDTVAAEAIAQGATPGCVVTVLRHGKLAFQQAYGYLDFQQQFPVATNTIYDLASVTKVSATTVAVMKLVEEGKLDVKKKVSDYLPWLKGGDKENITIENLLLHQAGLVSWIPFYKEVTDAQTGNADPKIFSHEKTTADLIDVSDHLFMSSKWIDTMFQRIKTSNVVTNELKYVYSDNDFILLGKVVEAISGMTLDVYVKTNFYEPLGMASTGFKPYEHFAITELAPTEREKTFRQSLVWGYVHDPGAAMFGNVAGHAGLFSNASDLGVLYQMLLNGGEFGGKRYLKKETIDWFTSYQTPISRRGLGFDKPEKNNDTRSAKTAYPAQYVSPKTYGHTGFTGTCVWVDPQYDLVYIFLSNRVNEIGGDNRKLLDMSVRSRIQEIVYESLEDKSQKHSTKSP
ncbi:MAG TPA: glycoside hydrolase family 3 N-terminal domain-containing protein [Phnomibacter sp.]|nr:glycoside hydrolase family 3 N-terminal domain-containing protein [Phnomibacter sp.]